MSNVVFDYSALSDAKSYAKKVVTGWGCMDSYKDGIKGKLSSPLDEWRLSGEVRKLHIRQLHLKKQLILWMGRKQLLKRLH